MKQGHHGAHRKLEAEPQGNVNQHQNQGENHRRPALIPKLLAHLRTHVLNTFLFHVRLGSRQGFKHSVTQFGAVLTLFRLNTHQDLGRLAKMLHRRVTESGLCQLTANVVYHHGFRVSHFHLGAAGKIQTVVQATGCQQHDGQHKQHRGYRQCQLAVRHELEIGRLHFLLLYAGYILSVCNGLLP